MQRDAAYLRDILEAARLLMSYLNDIDQPAFEKNLQLQDAVIRRLEIMGEAARRVSEQTKSEHPDIPWRQMVGMRNQVIHMYDGVDVGIIWQTAQEDIPSLVAMLEAIMDSEKA